MDAWIVVVDVVENIARTHPVSKLVFKTCEEHVLADSKEQAVAKALEAAKVKYMEKPMPHTPVRYEVRRVLKLMTEEA